MVQKNGFKMWLHLLVSRFNRSKSTCGVVHDSLDKSVSNSPSVLILSGSKKNQNFYRDKELARQTRAIFLSEDFDFSSYSWDVSKICADFIGVDVDWIFINYIHSYTHKLQGLDRVGKPVLGFVGDHYDFLDQRPAALQKQKFFHSIPLVGMVTAYPHTNSLVAQALGNTELPFFNLFWGIDSSIFKNMGTRRKYDIACMGALTEGKYPFRRQVRFWLEDQKVLRLFRKKRVKGKGGSDHDGEAFNLALNRVRSAFTCASSMRYLLMKYFEIPASGALLFAESIPDFDALGFVDGEHYIAVTPENYREKMIYYLHGPGKSEGEQIARTGYEFVHAYHTWEQRIRVFLPQVYALVEKA